jgi:hypothetical protein
MRTAELLTAIANWLESSNNEAMLLAEGDDDCLHVVAESCVLAAALLKSAAEEVDMMEPTESVITPESIEETAALATALDSSSDPQLKKMASVLDELLMTVAAPPNVAADKKIANNNRIEELRKKYQGIRETWRAEHKIADVEKAIDKSGLTKSDETIRPLEEPLNTRYCPDHPGAQIARVGENLYQCELDHKTYDYQTGYTLNNGKKVPGGDVSQQTQGVTVPFQAVFDDRNGRLQVHKF